MSYYTDQIRTIIVDAQFHSSLFRDEFRLGTPSTLYTSDLRIHGLGLVVNNATMVGAARYNLASGAHGIVKSLTLYSGAMVLDQISSFPDWAAFTNYKHTNQFNTDAKVLARAGYGFIHHRGMPDATNRQPVLIKEATPDMGVMIGDNSQFTPAGMLSLKSVFPLLGQLPYLHTDLLKDLRVVIEYVGASPSLLSSSNGNKTITETTLPILVCDVILNQKVASEFLSNFNNVGWNAIEMDSVILPQDVSHVKLRLQAFTNKFLTSLTVQKKPASEGSQLFGTNCSQFVFGQAVQVVVNGSNLLAENGVVRPSQQLMLLTDTWGNFNAIPCGANGSVYSTKVTIDEEDSFVPIIENSPQRDSKMDWFACVVNQRVTSLDLDFSRELVTIADVNTAQYNQKIVLQCWGTVRKSIQKTKDGFAVLYN